MSDEDSEIGICTTIAASQKKPTPWYESIFWGPLVIALIGAFIAASTQITATILPITFGPASLCDFSITADPGTDNIFVYSNTGLTNISENITVTDLHKWIKPYQHPIYVTVIGDLPIGVSIHLQNKAGTLPLRIRMDVQVDNSSFVPDEYEILIQGKGETGLVRNCTYFLNLQNKATTKNKDYRTYGYEPAGVMISALGEKFYTYSRSGNQLTREEYIAKYNIDPEINWEMRHPKQI